MDRILGLSLFILGWPMLVLLPAQEEAPFINPFEPGYSLRSWSTDDGLLGSNVQALLQDSSGYVVIGNQRGVVRYNGIGFEDLGASAPPGTPLTKVLHIHEDGDGRLWLSGLNGQCVREPDGSFRTLGPDQGGRPGICAFASDASGRVWCARSTVAGDLGLSVFENDRFQPMVDAPLKCGFARRLMFDAQGQLWLTITAVQGNHSLFRLEGRAWVPQRIPGERFLCLFRKPGDDRLWLAGCRGIYVHDREHWQQTMTFSQPLPVTGGIEASVVDLGENHWIGTRRHGVWIISPNGNVRRLTSEKYKLPGFVRDLMIDREGTLWLNGENELLQLYHRPFVMWPAYEQFAHSPIRGIGEDGKGTLWFASNGIYRLDPGGLVIEHQPASGSRLHACIIAGRPEGGAYFTTQTGPLQLQTAQGDAIAAANPPNRKHFNHALLSSGGNTWVAKASGLYRLQDGTLLPNNPPSMPNTPALCLADGGSSDKLFAGYAREGVFLYEDGQWTAQGLRGMSVPVLSMAPDGGLWAGANQDQIAWQNDGQWFRVSAQALGVPDNFSMRCASDGSLWFHADGSPVIRLNRQSVEAWMLGKRNVDLERTVFGETEGLASIHASETIVRNTLFEDSRGRIWVATDRGPCVHDPSKWQRSTGAESAPMPLVIEKLKVGHSEFTRPPSRLTLNPDQRQFEIHYAGLDLTNPRKVTYRYRLRGFDQEWNDVGSRHVAYYQDLPPGNYEFHVIGADHDGNWNDVGASLPLTIKPYWWERPIVKVSLPLLLALLMASAVYLKMRAKNRLAEERAAVQEQFSRRLIEAQEAERKRIAADLHDDFGQDLLVMKGRVDMARRKLDAGANEGMLAQLADTTLGLIKKARSLSHELRPLHLEHLGLSSCVRHLAKDFYDSTPIRFQTDIDDLEGLLPAESEIVIYRLIQESLNNIVKHSEAKEVRIRMKHHDKAISISIADDGKGFDPDQPDGEKGRIGHGLTAMKERCALIGAHFEVHSGPGKGTRIQIEVPIADSVVEPATE